MSIHTTHVRYANINKSGSTNTNVKYMCKIYPTSPLRATNIAGNSLRTTRAMSKKCTNKDNGL